VETGLLGTEKREEKERKKEKKEKMKRSEIVFV